jgi:hypothetical protein
MEDRMGLPDSLRIETLLLLFGSVMFDEPSRGGTGELSESPS